VLNRELAAVAAAIDKARASQATYGDTLAKAAVRMSEAADSDSLGVIVSSLSDATQRIRRHTNALERRLESSNREVVKLRDHLEQARRDAMTDALTNLANRKAFDEQLLRMCDEAETGGSSIGLAIIDIDHFKRFNDTWGHQTGDQVLRYVASVLGRVARAPRVAARYGGEEFAVIFPGETAGAVEAALNAIREEIASRALRRRSTNDDLGAVTISVGFALRRAGETATQVLERADEALYASKRGGRNRVTSAESVASVAA
jgi:diguanylate cyclase